MLGWINRLLPERAQPADTVGESGEAELHFSGVGFWGWVKTVLAAAAVLAICAVSATMNWRFGFGLGRTPFDGYVLAGASVAADILKALLPFFIFAAMRNKLWGRFTAGSFLWVVVMGFAITGAIGHASLNRSDSAQTRTVSANDYKDTHDSLRKKTDQLSWIPQHRPAETLLAEIDAQKMQRQWSASESCKDIKGSGQRNFCQGIQRLQAELGSARQAEKLSGEIAELNGKLGKYQDGAPAEGDPQVKVLAKMSSMDVGSVAAGLILFLVLMLESVSSFGLYVIHALHVEDRRRPLNKSERKRHAVNAATAVSRSLGVPVPPDTGEAGNDNAVNDDAQLPTAPAAASVSRVGSSAPILLQPAQNVYLPSSVAERAALDDLVNKLIPAEGTIPSQRALARRWKVNDATVSRWMALWQAKGFIDRGPSGTGTNHIRLGGAGADLIRAAA